MRLSRGFLVCLLSVVFLLNVPVMGGESIASYLPKDTLLLLRSPDVPAGWKGFQKAALYRFWKDPQIQKIYQKLKVLVMKEMESDRDFQEFQKLFNQRVGVSLMQFPGRLCAGELALGVTRFRQVKNGPPEVGFFLSAEYGEQREIVEKALDLLIEMVREQKPEFVEKMTVGEGKVLRIGPPKNDINFFLTHEKGRLFVTVDKSLMTFYLAHLFGDMTGTLESDGQYQASMKRVHQTVGLGEMYLNLEGLLATLKQQNILPGEFQPIAEVLGVETIKTMAGGLGLSGEGMTETLFVGMTPERKGLTRILEALNPGPIDGSMAKFASKDALSYSAFGMDLPAILSEVRKMVKGIDPDTYEEFESGLAELKNNTGVSLDEILALFGKDFVTIGGPVTMSAGGAFNPNAIGSSNVIVARIEDGKRFQEVLSKILDAVGIQEKIQNRMQGDRKIFRIQSDEGPVPMSVSWSIDEEHVFLAITQGAQVDEDGLKDFFEHLDSGKPTLMSSSDYKQVRSQLPQSMHGFYYSDLGRTLSTLYEGLKPTLKELLQGADSPLDVEDLPSSEVFSKYFRGMGGGWKMDESGVTMHTYGPTGNIFTLIGGVGVGAALVLPALSKVKGKAQWTKRKSEFKQLGLAFHLFQDSVGRFPRSIDEVREKGFLNFPIQGVLYAYSDKLQVPNRDAHKTIMAYSSEANEEFQRIVLFGDGHVESLSEFEFRQQFQQHQRALRKVGVTLDLERGVLNSTSSRSPSPNAQTGKKALVKIVVSDGRSYDIEKSLVPGAYTLVDFYADW